MWMNFVKFRYSEKNTKFQKAVGNFDLSKDVGKSKDLESKILSFKNYCLNNFSRNQNFGPRVNSKIRYP